MRLIYWIMAIVEIILVILTILLFIISDSRTINIVAKDLLLDYNITYQKIYGNLFTGIEIKDLKYNNKRVANNIIFKWNSLALFDNKINITNLKVESANINSIISIINAFPQTKDNSRFDIFFDFYIDKIDITANSFKFNSVNFKDFNLKAKKIKLTQDMKIGAKAIKLSLKSDLANMALSADIRKKRLRVYKVTLKKIDIDTIVLFINSINKTKKSASSSFKNIFLEDIKIDRLFASIKKVTYDPITLEKINILLKKTHIDLKNSYKINTKRVEILSKTSFADTKQIGYITESKLYTKGDVVTRDYLFDLYSLPLNRKELKRLPARVELNSNGLFINIENSVKKLLILNNDFNVNLIDAKHRLKYIFSDKKISISSKAKASMNYSNDSNISSLVLIDIKKGGYTTYQGKVYINKIRNIHKDISKNFLKDLEAKYIGNSKKLSVDFKSKQIIGTFLTKGYEFGDLNITSKDFLVDNILKNMPIGVKNSFANFKSSSFIDFKNINKTKVDIDLKSDILNIKSSFNLKKPIDISFSAKIPKKSKLLYINKDIKLNRLSNINGYVTLDKNNRYNILLNSRELQLSLDYNSKNNYLTHGLLIAKKEKIKFRGDLDKKIEIYTNIKDIDSFSKTLIKYYNINIPKIKGEANIKLVIYNSKKIDIELKSKKLNIEKNKIYEPNIKLSISNNEIDIKRYSFRYYNNYITDFFSTKSSHLKYIDNKLSIKDFWINDKIVLSGDYNIKNRIGDINIFSKYFSFKNIDFDLASKIDLNLKINRDNFFISGVLNPLGKSIFYENIGGEVSQDSDIIIVEDKRKKDNSFLKNIKMNVRIKNEKPFKYISDNIKIEFTNDITIIKDYAKDFMLFGKATVNSGYYQQDKKRFFLNQSHIYFSGDPKKPLLEIKATYNKEQYNIQIFISGTTDDPIINFNSNPYLSQKEILSLILFDSTGENSGGATELYSLLGGTFAKELMKSLGLSVDHLVLGQGIDERLSVEVGEKISDNITVIYQHNNGKDGVKVRVDHSKNFESDITMYPPNSSSIEFLYKSD